MSGTRVPEGRWNRWKAAAAGLLLGLSLLVPARAAAQAGAVTDVLRGQVSDERGQPVAAARVEARDLESGLRRATTTGANGRYTLVFPEGSGRYELAVSRIGTAGARLQLEREGDEDVLVANVQLRAQAVALEPLRATGSRAHGAAGHAEAGSRERTLSGDLGDRLPLGDYDPGRLATLSPGVVATPGDEGAGAGFSVAGQRSSQNLVTLDGATFGALLAGAFPGAGGVGLPQDGIRATRVITSTWDVARGQFAGGQVESTTRAGTSVFRGSSQYQLRDDRLDGRAGRTPWADGYTQQRLTGGLGGPLVRDRLFYYLSFTAQRRQDRGFSLQPRSAAGLAGVGVTADSVARFLAIAQDRYGVPADGQTGVFARDGSAYSLLGRVDYVRGAHTLAVRGFGNGSRQENAFVRPLDARQHGGTLSGSGWTAIATLTSQLGGAWINELRASASADRRRLSSPLALPEARVLVASTLADGTVQAATLSLGGDPLFPRSGRESGVEVADELSWLLGGGHRVKLGGLLQRFGFSQSSVGNRYGSFAFASLADFAAGRPASFTRTLSAGTATGNGWNTALYLGDAWRAAGGLQLTYGVRLEGSRFGGLAAGPADSVFGVDAGRAPHEVRLSPRLGFSWRLNARGRPLQMLRGGVGEFRGRVPTGLFADALDANGPGAPGLLTCAGDGSVPVPDFPAYAADSARIPTTCAGGPAVTAGAVPGVVAFAPGFRAPRSWRATLGYQGQFWRLLGGAVDFTYARGVDLYRVRDLNLRGQPRLGLADELGRPLYADPASIDPRTGEAPLFASRVDPRYGNAFLLESDARSETRQVTFALNGVLPGTRLSFQSSYTWARSRDQTSFSVGGARAGFSSTVTGGDPNRLAWGRSDLDRPHTVIAVAGMPLGRGAEMSLIARGGSGIPFTPRVAGDVNGDGFRNDAAFVFDPATAADPVVAQGMESLLAGAPDNVRNCLRGQLGRVAARNACRTPWSMVYDLRASFTPGIAGRRATLAVEAYNLGAGLDLLLHGRDDLRGWGQGGRGVDPVLLVPRGYDPARGAWRYQVNQAFGRSRFNQTIEGVPFSVQLTTRLALGPRPRTDPLGGFADLGTPGIASGALTRISMTGAAGGRGTDAIGGSALDDADEPGHGPGPARLIARLLPEPVSGVLALADSLGLTPDQVTRITVIRDSLKAKNDPIFAEVSRVFNAAFMGQGDVVEPDALYRTIGPPINEGRRNVAAALDQVQAALTPGQWARVPDAIKQAVASPGLRLMNPSP